MQCVRLITDPFDLSSYSEHECEDVIAFLQTQFKTWPETARLYKHTISVDHDITPQTEEDIVAIQESDPDQLFYVVVYPGDPITAIVTAVATLALAALLLLFIPRVPRLVDNSQSSNNSLGNRVNKARPNERVPDIFGTVISVPELLTVPLLYYENNLERELCYMCVGRGDHTISAVKDGDTPLTQIAGAAATFYGPFTSPNSGDPILHIGDSIDKPLLDVIRINDVNGQLLRAPNANQVSGEDDIRFVYPDRIEASGSEIDFTKFFGSGDQLTVQSSSVDSTPGSVQVIESAKVTSAGEIVFETYDPSAIFEPGDNITISNGGYTGATSGGGVQYVDVSGTYIVDTVGIDTITLEDPASVNGDWDLIANIVGSETGYRSPTLTKPVPATGYNLDGTYNVVSVSSNVIVLSNPALVNAAWNNLSSLPGGATDYISPSLSTSGERWVGPFVVDMPTCDTLVINIVAQQGMYLVTKKGKYRPRSVTVEVEATPVDVDGIPIGPAQLGTVAVNGDGKDKTPQGVSLWMPVSEVGRYSVRVRRLTHLDLESKDTIIDEVRWRDCYGTAVVTQDHFGDITTVHTLTLATSGATSVKERKLNCRATRKVLERNPDNSFGPALVPSRNAADIICHMALDPYIGGRSVAELDVVDIYATLADVVDYFGFIEAGEFCHTFDDGNISFEEMVTTVAQAVFCTAYRQGSQLRLFFERETSDSVLLFNHRNKEPGSETRTVRFGTLNDHDGVEVDYVSPVDGAKLTIYLPENRQSTKAKKFELIGVQDERQAYIHAARAWQKIQYQYTTCQFNAYAEATQLVLNQRIEIADNTRSDVIDGEIRYVNGLSLGLSQPFEPVAGTSYIIQIQLPSGKVQTLDFTATDDPYIITLASPPEEALNVLPDQWALPTYQIVSSGGRPSAFLLAEKGAYSGGTLSVQAINYDPRYYSFDLRYKES